jgi:hypothetical protein
MRYTIYQTTNKNNGKIYIGKHQTENPNDSYLGSGISLRNAIKKYGIENFEKIILFDFDTEQEMNNKEREIITEEFVKRKDTYNKGVGGEGGPHFRGKKHSLESRQKMGIPGKKIYLKKLDKKYLKLIKKEMLAKKQEKNFLFLDIY